MLSSLFDLINNGIVRDYSGGIYYTESLNIKNNSVYFGNTLITNGEYQFYKLPVSFIDIDSIHCMIPYHECYFLMKEHGSDVHDNLVLYYQNNRISDDDIKIFEIKLGDNLPDLDVGSKIYIQYLDIDIDSMNKQYNKNMTSTKYNKIMDELCTIKDNIKTEYVKAHMLKESNFHDLEVISDIKMQLLETIYPKVKSEVYLPKIKKVLPY